MFLSKPIILWFLIETDFRFLFFRAFYILLCHIGFLFRSRFIFGQVLLYFNLVLFSLFYKIWDFKFGFKKNVKTKIEGEIDFKLIFSGINSTKSYFDRHLVVHNSICGEITRLPKDKYIFTVLGLANLHLKFRAKMYGLGSEV